MAAYFRQVFAQSSLPNSQDPTEEEKDLLASDLDSLLDETLDETLERTHEEALNQAYEAYFDQYLETADPYTQYFENAAPVEAPPALIMDLDSIVLPEGFPPREIDPDDYADDDPAPVEAPPGKLPSAMESLVELLPRYSLILLALGVLGYGVVTLAPTMLASNLLGLGVAVAVQGCGYHPALAVLLSYLTRSLLLELLSRWQRP